MLIRDNGIGSSSFHYNSINFSLFLHIVKLFTFFKCSGHFCNILAKVSDLLGKEAHAYLSLVFLTPCEHYLEMTSYHVTISINSRFSFQILKFNK